MYGRIDTFGKFFLRQAGFFTRLGDPPRDRSAVEFRHQLK
jgi:hypothetical protein